MKYFILISISFFSILSHAQISILKNDNGDALRYSVMTYMAHTDSSFYFIAGNSGTEITGELHKSDGTVNGTSLVRAYNAGSGQFGIANSFINFHPFNSGLLFNSNKTGEGFTLRELKFENDSIETISNGPSTRSVEVYCNADLCFFTHLENGLISYKKYDGVTVTNIPQIDAAGFTDVSLAHVKGNSLYFGAVDASGDWKLYRYNFDEMVLNALDGYYPAPKQRLILLQIEINGNDALAMINFQTVGKEISLINLVENEMTSLIPNPTAGTEYFGQALQNHIFQFNNTMYAWLPVGTEELSLVEFNPQTKSFTEIKTLKRPSPFNQMRGPLVREYNDKYYFVARLPQSQTNQLIEWSPDSDHFNSLLDIDADINYLNEIHDGIFFQSVTNQSTNYVQFYDLNSKVDVKYYLEDPCPQILIGNRFISTSPDKYITIASCPGNGVTFFTFEISGSNSTIDIQSSIASWQLYPNPADNLLFIKSKNPQDFQNCEWSVLDINGRILKSGTVSGSESSLDLSTLHSGLYILTLQYGRFVESHRIIKK